MNERSLHTRLELRPIALLTGQRVRLVEASRVADQGVTISGPNSEVIRFPSFEIPSVEQDFQSLLLVAVDSVQRSFRP